jgi:hypothetical protein
MSNSDKKVPRTIRNLDTSSRQVHFNDKILYTAKEVAWQRLEICKACNQLNDWGCEVNGFFMPRQTRLKSAHCPLGKWSFDYKTRKQNGKDD